MSAAAEQLAVFLRGAVDLVTRDELESRVARSLELREPLRIKLGMDPTAPDLHLGHAVQLFKLRALQELGHQIVLIVGDGTARIGDPSGRSKLRPELSADEIEANLETYRSQAGLILDLEATEVHRNFDWLGKMGFDELLSLQRRMTVAQMLERDMYQERIKNDQPIGLHEFMYPLTQGWDSVVIRADLELGGTDQLFNLHVGRRMQEQEGQPRQVVMTQKLIVGTDGRKMSKSYGNSIGLAEPATSMYAKVMSISDESMPEWFLYLTRLAQEEIDALLAGHPMEAKARLAAEITTRLHGAAGAEEGRQAFDSLVRNKELPDDIPERAWPSEPGEPLPLAILLRELGLASSSSDARRSVQGGGVRVGGEVVREPMQPIAPPAEGGELLVQVGKRRFARVTTR